MCQFVVRIVNHSYMIYNIFSRNSEAITRKKKFDNLLIS